MTTGPRIPQSTSELKQHLSDYIGFLKGSADAFDRGLDGEAKRLAVSLRVLCHDTGSSHSLLGQLGLLSKPFLSTAIPFDARNVSTHNGLAVIAARGRETVYLPMLDTVPMRRRMSFADWWGEIVFADDRRAQFSRKALVLAVANQDGGAHVDPALNETYARLSRHNSLGWVIKAGAEELPIPKPERAAVRQITHEVLATLVPGYKKEQTQEAEMFFGGAMAFDGIPAEWQSQTRLGRNDPCPCGSGKKFKRCHGAA